MGEEKNNSREFPRTHCEIKMEYRSADDFMEAYMMQVGKGGLFIHSDDPPPMGAEIDLTFTIPGDPSPIQAKGRVIWRMDNPGHDVFDMGVGIKFSEISEEDRKRIGEFVESHKTE